MLGLGGILSVVLLIPYVGWGVYMLRKRYILREELPLRVEGVTLGALVLFYAVEISLSNTLFTNDRLMHIMAILGLFVSGTALYGPMLNDFFSRIIVELVTHGHESAPDQPRFGPAESLEYQGDYDGALKEYIILARIYPWHPDIYLRVAELCLRSKNYDDAVTWLDRGLKRVKTARQCLPLLLRLCDIFSDHMDQPDKSRQILDAFAARFPRSPEGDAVRERLMRNQGDFCAQVSLMLEDMEEIALAGMEEDGAAPREVSARKPAVALEALEASALEETAPPKTSAQRKGSSIKLEAMDGDGQNN